MEEEIWKDVPGWEGLYKVSSCGRILSVSYNHSGRPAIRVLRKDWLGYLVVTLHRNNYSKTYKVHRLVAMAFIPNPTNLPCINHRDEDKTNNRVENLEWCDYSYNNKYGSRPRKVLDAYKRKKSAKAERPVVKMDKTGIILEEFISISAAARAAGVCRESLRDAVLGRSKTCAGYVWKYLE